MEDGNLRSGSCDGVTKIDLEDGSMDVSAEDAGGISTLVDSKRVEMIPDEVVWDPDEGEEDSGLFSVGDNEGEEDGGLKRSLLSDNLHRRAAYCRKDSAEKMIKMGRTLG